MRWSIIFNLEDQWKFAPTVNTNTNRIKLESIYLELKWSHWMVQAFLLQNVPLQMLSKMKHK